MKTQLDIVLGNLVREGKLCAGEAIAIMAAMDCLTYEIENKGPQAARLLREYGTQLHDEIEALNKVIAPKGGVV